MEKNILCVDIGGTKTRIAFCKKNKGIKIVFSEIYDSKRIKDFGSVVNDFLLRAKKRYKINIGGACISVAGPVSDEKARITNLKTIINAKRLSKDARLKKIRLINDFAATCLSIDFLKRNDLLKLKKGKGKRKIRVIIGSGTGLGIAAAIDGRIVSSEGGHMDAVAENDFEFALLNYLKRNACRGKWPDYEAIVSGPGIVNIYRFLQKIKYAKQIPRIKKEIEKLCNFRACSEKQRQMLQNCIGNIYKILCEICKSSYFDFSCK